MSSCERRFARLSRCIIANFAQVGAAAAAQNPRRSAGTPTPAGARERHKQRAPRARCAPAGQAAADRARRRGMARRRATAREQTAQRAARRARSEREQSELGGTRAGGRKRRRRAQGESDEHAAQARTPRRRSAAGRSRKRAANHEGDRCRSEAQQPEGRGRAKAATGAQGGKRAPRAELPFDALAAAPKHGARRGRPPNSGCPKARAAVRSAAKTNATHADDIGTRGHLPMLPPIT